MAVIDASELATITGLASDVAARLRAVCLPIIEKYADDAPDEVKSEALIRMTSYLDSSKVGMAIRELKSDRLAHLRVSRRRFSAEVEWVGRAHESLAQQDRGPVRG